MLNPNFSCKGCSNRKPGCHGKCDKYKREKEAHEERKRQEQIQRGLDAAEGKRLYRVNQLRTNKNYRINKGGAHQ